MGCILAGYTDKGKRKKVNQDSMLIRNIQTPEGVRVFLAAICDGMGGFDSGELASSKMNQLFSAWFETSFLKIADKEDVDEFEDALYESWEELFQTAHRVIRAYGETHQLKIGTTATAMLCMKDRYYTAHVGDGRIYEIKGRVIHQLTQDQNMASVSLKNYLIKTEEKKKASSILLQGIGASKAVCPVYNSGELKYDTMYLLCSDGFRNRTDDDELINCFSPEELDKKEVMKNRIKEFISNLRARGEKDDITALLLRTSGPDCRTIENADL